MLRRPSHGEEVRRQLGRHFMEEGLALWRCRQQELLFKKAAEQVQLRDMMSTYSPWGRPGGGAPNADSIRKRHTLHLEALHNRNASSSPLPGGLPKSSASTPSNTWRRRAPIRRPDPLMWFQPTEPSTAAVLNELRYARPEPEQEAYKKQLDAIVQEKKRAKDDEHRKEVTVDQQLRRMPLPWGRPGPGGTVWRNPRLIGSKFSHSMGWTDDSALRDLVKKDPAAEHEGSVTSPTSPVSNPQTPEAAEVPPTPTPEATQDASPAMSPTEPADAGDAPPQSAGSAKSSGSRQSYQLPRAGNTNGVELVPLLAKRRNAPRLYLGTTDVTKPHEPHDGRDLPIEAHRDYWKALQQQIDRKRIKLEASRAEDIESSKRHFETWQLLWGRPGHGAPRPIKVKEKLDVLLYQLPQLQLAAR